MHLKNYPSVVKLSTELLTLEPQNYKILSLRAAAEYFSGNYESALIFYYRGLSRAPRQERDRLREMIRNKTSSKLL